MPIVRRSTDEDREFELDNCVGLAVTTPSRHVFRQTKLRGRRSSLHPGVDVESRIRHTSSLHWDRRTGRTGIKYFNIKYDYCYISYIICYHHGQTLLCRGGIQRICRLLYNTADLHARYPRRVTEERKESYKTISAFNQESEPSRLLRFTDSNLLIQLFLEEARRCGIVGDGYGPRVYTGSPSKTVTL